MDAPQPDTTFDWAIYADATFAGLSVLIPIPGVDVLFERYFHQRLPWTITARRNQVLEPIIINQVNKSAKGKGCFLTCLTLPVLGVYFLLKSLSRKILYFLTVKAATDQVSYYWHKAFLLDYMLVAGHLESEASARRARHAMDQALLMTTTSPLLNLAAQVVSGPGRIFRIFRALYHARRGEEDELIEQKKEQMLEQWTDFDEYFRTLADRYHQTYDEIKVAEATNTPKPPVVGRGNPTR